VLVDNKAKKRKILKRPKRFKNYYSDRMPLSIPSFSFPRFKLNLIENFKKKIIKKNFFSSFYRFGEQFSFRGRQTLCKYYDSNELINNQLIRIKSATTANEFERIFHEQHRNKQSYSKSAKSIQPYYDTEAVLQQPTQRPSTETCLCAKEFYRLDYNLLPKPPAQVQHHHSNAIKRLAVDVESNKSFDAFLQSASECYDTCIQYYLNHLNVCNQQAEFIERQSAQKRPATSCSLQEISLINQLQKLNINLEKSSTTTTTST
jgi:hypothetical protein